MEEMKAQFNKLNLADVIERAQRLPVNMDDPYIAVYDELITHAAKTSQRADLMGIVGIAHMAYGWMPRILALDLENIDPPAFWYHVQSTDLEVNLNFDFLRSIRRAINNSVVGASKLLHFVAPHRYAIWDSRVYKALTGKTGYSYRVNDEETYRAYVGRLHELSNQKREAAELQAILMNKGYLSEQASALRAIELALFMSTP